MIDDEKLLRDLLAPKWSRFKQTGQHAADRIADLKAQLDQWKSAAEQSYAALHAMRNMRVNDAQTDLADRMRRSEGSIDTPNPRRTKMPNPWNDA